MTGMGRVNGQFSDAPADFLGQTSVDALTRARTIRVVLDADVDGAAIGGREGGTQSNASSWKSGRVNNETHGTDRRFASDRHLLLLSGHTNELFVSTSL
jgi:hypothetical protein